MKIQSVEFITSADSLKGCPKPDLPEIAFAGRSNVGKSSLINALLKRKSLAKVSTIPGKTRLINFFNINGSFHFVDLPGYGYARRSKVEKKRCSGQQLRWLCSRHCERIFLDSRNVLF